MYIYNIIYTLDNKPKDYATFIICFFFLCHSHPFTKPGRCRHGT